MWVFIYHQTWFSSVSLSLFALMNGNEEQMDGKTLEKWHSSNNFAILFGGSHDFPTKKIIAWKMNRMWSENGDGGGYFNVERTKTVKMIHVNAPQILRFSKFYRFFELCNDLYEFDLSDWMADNFSGKSEFSCCFQGYRSPFTGPLSRDSNKAIDHLQLKPYP